MEIRLLHYFIAVAEELNFSRAAERLNMSQPPLSRQIIKLEEELGVKLLDRTKQKVELTEGGKEFLKQSYEILDRIEQACVATRRVANGETGHLSIGYSGSMHNLLLQTLFHYRGKFPNVDIALTELSSTGVREALEKREIEIGILPPYTSHFFNFYTIIETPFIAALAQSHPLASEPAPLDVKALAKENFILPPRRIGTPYYDTIISLCTQAGFSPNIVQEVNGLTTIFTLVAAGAGITIVSKLAMEHPNHGIVFKELTPVKTIATSLAWRKDEKSSIVKNFLTTAREFLNNRT